MLLEGVPETFLIFYGDEDGGLSMLTFATQSPYIPDTAVKLKDVPDGAVPFISTTDLIAFKINSGGSRAKGPKRHTGADDAQTLLKKENVQPQLSLKGSARHCRALHRGFGHEWHED